MSQPATGVAFKSSGLAYLDALRARRGGDWAIAVRDWNGSLTDISPGSAFSAPMALDGQWRDDLYAVKKVNGKWVYNMSDNQGFYPIGYVHPDGIERASKINSDPLEGLQSLDPLRVDMQSRSRTLMFTPFENSPIIHRLINNLPLSNVLDLGSGTYFSGESTDSTQIRRQVIVMHEDAQGGLFERNAFPFPRCVLTDQGSMKGNKKDADAPKLTLTRELDQWFVDVDGTPLIDGRWVAGTLWDDGLTPGLTFTLAAPVGTATSATAADLVFAQPLGGTSPFTYTVDTSADGSTGWTPATVGSTTVDSGVVTLGLTGLTTATGYYARVTVTDANSDTAVSKVSNLFTTE